MKAGGCSGNAASVITDSSGRLKHPGFRGVQAFSSILLSGFPAPRNPANLFHANSTPLSPFLPYATNSVSIGGVAAYVYFLGLTPTFEGLYQANAQVPALAAGDYAVVATVGGVSSNGPLLSIR